MVNLKYWLMGSVLLMLTACAEPETPKPTFDLTSLVLNTTDGKSIPMSSFGDRTLVINFWASWCAPCVKELPDLQAMAAEIDGEKYRVMLVSVDANPDQASRMLDDLNISLPAYIDPNMVLASEVFELTGFPETLIITPSGELHDRVLGSREWHKTEVWQKILP